LVFIASSFNALVLGESQAEVNGFWMNQGNAIAAKKTQKKGG